MLSILHAIDSENNVIDEPSDNELYAYFKNECDETNYRPYEQQLQTGSIGFPR